MNRDLASLALPNLRNVAGEAKLLVGQIRLWFPIAGTPWLSEVHESWVINNVLNVAIHLEGALRAVPHPLRGLWQPIHDALSAVERCHERVLNHYQWVERVKGTSAVWPWEWPKVPPIAPELVDALDKSARGLDEWVRDFGDALARSNTPASTRAGDDEGGPIGPEMTWREAVQRMERLRVQGEPWTSQHKMADQLGCSSGTINKAIKNTPHCSLGRSRKLQPHPKRRASTAW